MDEQQSIIKYPDGFSYAKLKEFPKEFIFRINSYEDLWHLHQILDVYKYFNIKPTVIIPNLPDAQADRRFNKNESHGLRLVCKFLNKMYANFKIFHPHNQEVVEALIDNVEIIDNSHFIHKILSINSYYNNDKLIIMSPDAGAAKWLGKTLDIVRWKGDFLSADKVRKDGKIVHQTVPLEDFKGKDVLIVDDICVYGGTFKGLAKLLKEHNCGKLYLAVSHLAVSSFQKEDNIFSYFDTVFTTNSKYDEYWIQTDGNSGKQPENLQIIKLF